MSLKESVVNICHFEAFAKRTDLSARFNAVCMHLKKSTIGFVAKDTTRTRLLSSLPFSPRLYRSQPIALWFLSFVKSELTGMNLHKFYSKEELFENFYGRFMQRKPHDSETIKSISSKRILAADFWRLGGQLLCKQLYDIRNGILCKLFCLRASTFIILPS